MLYSDQESEEMGEGGGAENCGRVEKKSFCVHEICLGMGTQDFFLTRERGKKKRIMVFDEEKGVLVNSKVLLMTSVYFGIQFLETAKYSNL